MFQDINLLAVVSEKTTRPDKTKDLYNVYFKLSATPDSLWKEIFNHVHENRFSLMLRKAYVQGEYILVYCGLDEVQKHHVGILKQDLIDTNRYYKEHLIKIEKQQEKERIEEQRSKQEVADKLNNIKI